MRSTLLLSLLGVALGAAPAAAQEAPRSTTAIPTLLPPNTLAYAHFKIPELWKSEHLAVLRKVVEHAGEDTVKNFDRRFAHLLSKMDTLTLVFPNGECTPELPTGRPEQRTVLWVITTKEPIDRVDLIKSLLAKAVTKKHRGYDYYFDERTWSGVMLPDANTLVYASEDSLWSMLDLKADAAGDGVLASLFREEAGRHAVHIGLDPTTFQKPETLRFIPDDFLAIFKAKTWSAAVSLTPELRVSGKMVFNNAGQAKDGEKAVQAVLGVARAKMGDTLKKREADFKNAPTRLPRDFFQSTGQLLSVGSLRYLDDILKTLPLDAKGTTLESSISIDAKFPHSLTGVQTFYLLAASELIFGRFEYRGDPKYALEDRLNRHANIVDALERCHRETGTYPAPSINGPNGKPVLSWRVTLLKYMGPGEKNLYDQFKLTEPWDGPNNRKLIGNMPYQFGERWREGPRTGFQLVTGPDTLFSGNFGINKNHFAERRDQAVLLVQVENPESRVIWTKPEDIAYDPKKPLPDLLETKDFKGLVIYTLDGNFRLLPDNFSQDNFRALFGFAARKPITDVSWKDTIRRTRRDFFDEKKPEEKKFEDKKFDDKFDKDKDKKGVLHRAPRIESNALWIAAARNR